MYLYIVQVFSPKEKLVYSLQTTTVVGKADTSWLVIISVDFVMQDKCNFDADMLNLLEWRLSIQISYHRKDISDLSMCNN